MKKKPQVPKFFNIFISLTILFLFQFSNAQLKDFVESIDEPTKQESKTPPSESDKNQKGSEYKIEVSHVAAELTWIVFKPILAVILLPIAPIMYDELGLRNPKQEAPLKNEFQTLEYHLGSGSSFSVNSFKYSYQENTSSFIVQIDSARERGFSADFFSLYYAYTPNWKKQLTTGAAFGVKFLSYSDETLPKNELLNGILISFPTQYNFRESKLFLLYSPQLTYYFGKNAVFEVELGAGYKLDLENRLTISIKHHSVASSTIVNKKELTYGALGWQHIF